MNTNKIREYVMVKDRFSHAKLEEVGCYDYYGELKYTDTIYEMLTSTFKMDRLITEVSYVIAFDHAKMPKGICKVGQGGISETPTPPQSIFTFLLLTGAHSFIVVHNHISEIPEASASDQLATLSIETIAKNFDMEFIGHMIINPNGYVIDGGVMKGTWAELDEDGEIISYTDESEGYEDDGFDEAGNKSEVIHVTSENVYEVAKMLREKADRKRG